VDGHTQATGATAYPALVPSLTDLLHAAVGGVGGTERPGQVEMAQAVADAIDTKSTCSSRRAPAPGKSLAYLVPPIQHAVDTGIPAVVATATLALQARSSTATCHGSRMPWRPCWVVVPPTRWSRGAATTCVRTNWRAASPTTTPTRSCHSGGRPAGLQARQAEVVRLREWAEVTESGDRDELVPGVSERAWRQVSVSAQECLGSRCPMVAECFVERSREAAADVDVIVTNHSFMAIDAFEGRQMLPEHDVLIIDEGHELVDRVTSTITDEVTPGMIRAAAKRAGRQADASSTMEEAADLLESVLEPAPEGRLTGIPDSLAMALGRVRDTARTVQSELKPQQGEEVDAGRQVALAAVDEVFENACRILEERELDVVWLSRDPRRGPSCGSPR
jgi:ATP-dependent DNA helicase DinG